jgi:hypothetical protein
MTGRRRTTTAAQAGLTGEMIASTTQDMCQRLGLKVARFPKALVTYPRDPRPRWLSPVQGDGKGWLDMLIIDPLGGGVLVREAKGDKETLTAEQRDWIGWWQANGFDVDVWRPADLRSGRIERELKAVVGRRLPHHQSLRTKS